MKYALSTWYALPHSKGFFCRFILRQTTYKALILFYNFTTKSKVNERLGNKIRSNVPLFILDLHLMQFSWKQHM